MFYYFQCCFMGLVLLLAAFHVCVLTGEHFYSKFILPKSAKGKEALEISDFGSFLYGITFYVVLLCLVYLTFKVGHGFETATDSIKLKDLL